MDHGDLAISVCIIQVFNERKTLSRYKPSVVAAAVRLTSHCTPTDNEKLTSIKYKNYINIRLVRLNS
jgi:hypothetical protein